MESNLAEASRNQFLFPIASEQKSPDLSRLFLCGPGGVRTRVQTRNQRAFYMLSYLVVFDKTQANNIQNLAYPVCLTSDYRICLWRSPFGEASLPTTRSGVVGETYLSNSLSQIKRNHIQWLGSKCVWIVVSYDWYPEIKEREYQALCMLTNCFFLLSNPRSGPKL